MPGLRLVLAACDPLIGP